MKCPKCQYENREGAKFCKKCGAKFEFVCPGCGKGIISHDKYCDECGYDLSEVVKDPGIDYSASKSCPPEQLTDKVLISRSPIDGERKHVTVLFSDLTGYTAISEKLDPEEVKEITSRIFGEISKIIGKYDGFIEKYAGDAVMAIFGVPKAHEDDPIRAVKAAREIHELVYAISPDVENTIGQSISMHTGINTGLVVTGEVNIERGTHGVAGGTINLASRLSNIAKPGEILIDADTCRQTEGHFLCEYLKETTVKGKMDPIKIHKVISQRDEPLTIHRLSGLRSDLVGRRVELAELSEAVDNLLDGRGRIFSVCGAAGTGKSRLVEEFKALLDLKQIQWIEGHAYAYSQNISYFPLIDLLNRIFGIEENVPIEKVREKIESGIKNLVGNQDDIIPYVGGLYSLSYSEVEDVSSELWKARLQSAVKIILSALANKAPTIFFLEDLHWSDPSFAELLRQACLEIQQPAIVLCVYRPTFSLFTSHQLSSVGNYYHEIQLQDLSRSEAQDMLESLLKTVNIPSDLQRLIQNKAEGNPFYLEELVNSLIESEALTQDNGQWRITKSLSETEVSSSIHGLISDRLDRLDKKTKRILQEASVIGRAFLYEILMKITELKDVIDGGLSTLERIDLIRTRVLQPDLEYMFKHPLTQEVVYNSVLKKERQEIHEKIALVIENIFHGRLAEFHETLAFHFSRGKSDIKAVDYLVKSGKKSLARYAVEEAHQYFKEAYDILASKTNKSKTEKIALIDILNSWAYTYYFLGEINEFAELFISHKDMADSLGDKAILGMFYSWIGLALFLCGKTKNSYEYLCNALEMGEVSGNEKAIGYACFSLTMVCADLGLFADGIRFGERALKISESFPSDQYLFFKSLGGLGIINWMKGDTKKVFEYTKLLLDYGERNSNSRCKVWGHWVKGCGNFLIGDMESSEKNCTKAIEVASDPLIIQFPKPQLALVYLSCERFQQVEDVSNSCLDFCEKHGIEQLSAINYFIYAPALIAKGRMKEGLLILEKSRQALANNQRRVWCALTDFVLGKVYSQIATGPKPSLSIMTKNIGFLVKNVPFASKKAEEHFKKAIEELKDIGAKGFLGPIFLDLGLLYKNTKRNSQARECFSEAIQLFDECSAEIYLKQAEEAMASLG